MSFAPSLSEGLHGTALVCKSRQDERSLCEVGMTHFSAPKMLVLLTRKLPTYSEGFQCFLSFLNSSSCLLPHHSILLVRTSYILCHQLTTSSVAKWPMEAGKDIRQLAVTLSLRDSHVSLHDFSQCSAAPLDIEVVGCMDFPCDSKQFSFTV